MATLEFDPPTAAPATGAPKLEFDAPAPISREQEIRRDNLKKLMATSGPEGSSRQTGRGYTNRLQDAWTSGLIRPVMGAVDTAVGEVGEFFGGKPATIGERYRGAVGAEEDYAKEMEKRGNDRYNVSGPATSFLGSLASAGTSTGKPLGLVGESVRAGVQGAVEGGARNAEDVGKATSGAATGGIVGAGTSAVVGGLLDRLSNVKGAVRDIGEASRGGTSQSKAAESGLKFDKLDNAGIHFGQKEVPELANKVNAAVAGRDTRGIDETLKLMNERTKGAMTFADVRDLQSKFSEAAASGDGVTRRVAKDANKALDDFLNTAKPTMPASSVGTVSKADLDDARRLYAESKHMGKIEGLAEAATTHSKDPAKSTAAAFEGYQNKFIKNPEKFNPNGPAEKRLIDEIIKTGKGGEGADKLAKASNSLTNYGTVTGALGAGGLLFGGDDKYVHGASAGAGAGGAGMLALGLLGKNTSSAMRQALARQTASKVDDLLRQIGTGSIDKTGAYIPRNALAILMAKQDAARGVGKAITSNITTE